MRVEGRIVRVAGWPVIRCVTGGGRRRMGVNGVRLTGEIRVKLKPPRSAGHSMAGGPWHMDRSPKGWTSRGDSAGGTASIGPRHSEPNGRHGCGCWRTGRRHGPSGAGAAGVYSTTGGDTAGGWHPRSENGMVCGGVGDGVRSVFHISRSQGPASHEPDRGGWKTVLSTSRRA